VNPSAYLSSLAIAVSLWRTYVRIPIGSSDRLNDG
jgi:hypothetical protein